MFFCISKAAWLFAEPSQILFAIALVGLALIAIGWTRAGRWLVTLPLGIMLLVSVAPVGGALLSSLESRFPEARDQGPIDGIVVLGGAIDPEYYFWRHGSGLNSAVARVFEAARLADKFKSARIIVAGGPAAVGEEARSEGQATLDILTSMGVEPGRISLDLQSRNTYENALYVKRIAQPKPGERWLLVTSAFHMPRAVGCFRAVGFPVNAYPVDYRYLGRVRFGFNLVVGLGSLDLALHEFAGLLAYYATGKIQDLYPAP